MDRLPGQYPFEPQPEKPMTAALADPSFSGVANSLMGIKMNMPAGMASNNIVDNRQGAPLAQEAMTAAQRLMGGYKDLFMIGKAKLGLGAPKAQVFGDDIEATISGLKQDPNLPIR